jgi:hypothetical protein
VTTLPYTGFNPNTADEETLMAYLGISKRDAARIRAAAGSIEGPGDMLRYSHKSLESMDYTKFVPSGYYEVTVKCRVNGAWYAISAGVGLKETRYFPYNIFYRREE